MSRYLSPLPRLLARAVDESLNQAIALDPDGQRAIQSLKDKLVCLQLEQLNISLYFAGHDERLEVLAESDRQPDTTISGSPAALLAMAVPDWRAMGSGVRIDGDAAAAQALERLLRKLDPDWEALLTRVLGDILGHQLWRFLKSTLTQSRELAEVAGDQLAHYLREESGLLVSRSEMRVFSRDVDELREACDRLIVRLRRQGLA